MNLEKLDKKCPECGSNEHWEFEGWDDHSSDGKLQELYKCKKEIAEGQFCDHVKGVYQCIY